MLILLTKHRIATGKKDRTNADLQRFKHTKTPPENPVVFLNKLPLLNC